MTLHAPKPKWETPRLKERAPARPTWRNAPPPTIGSVLGAALRAELAKKARRAELDAAGFRALGGA